MFRVRRSSLIFAVFAAAALQAQPSASSAAAPLLNLDVVAVDRHGNPVADLKPAEFEVWINGFRIPIQTVTFVTPSNAPDGRTTVLLLDDMTLTAAMLPRVREAARRFVNRMAPNEVIAVVTLDGGRVEATSDRARLLRAIDDYHVRSVPIRVDDAGAHVLKTIASIARQLAETPGGRKAIVGIGAGWLFDRPIPGPFVTRDLRPEWVDAMRATAAARVSLYAIDPAGVGTRPATGGTSGFARETGGFAFLNTNDVSGAADRILAELGTYYVLSVEDPPFGRKDDLRELDVKVLRKGVTVRARRGILPGV
jgi:VWFA-related protein